MPGFYFEREARTAQSECYNVLQDGNAVGRLDVHFTNHVVHATLTVAESLTSDDIQAVIDAMDEELIDAVGVERQELIVHVHQGRDLGVFTSRDFESNGGHDHMN